LLAATVGAPIVPITIAGAFFVYPKGEKFPKAGRISIRVHPPLPVDPTRRRERGYLEEVTGAVMERITRSLTPALRARRRRDDLMKKSVPVAWYEYMPAGAALALFLASVLRGDLAPLRLLATGLIAVGVPLWLAVARRVPLRGWGGFARHFLPLLLLFPLYHDLAQISLPAAQLARPAGEADTGLYLHFAQGAVIAYLFALLSYAFLRNFAGFRRLSLGIQATSYLAVLPLLFLPFLPVSANAHLLVVLMTFLLFYDFLYRQPSLIASFIILAVLKVIVGLGEPFDPAAEVVALLIPGAVLAVMRVSGFPRG
jgi:hypothetical protein